MSREITEETVIDVLDTDEPKGRVEILNELGYDTVRCECCGQVTNRDAYNEALNSLNDVLRLLSREARISSTPEWKWLLSPSEV